MKILKLVIVVLFSEAIDKISFEMGFIRKR